MGPDVFWSLSMQEWFCAVEGHSGKIGDDTRMGRSDLDELMEQYPDVDSRDTN